MPNEETKILQVDTTSEDIKTLQKSYDELYTKYVQLLDEFEERNQPIDPGVNKELVTYSAEITCDATYPGYCYFRIDEDMTKVNNIYVDVYPVDYRSPVTL
jgi:hypothetical protein